MPRPRKEYVSLTGRVIAEGGSTQEEVDFVRKKLKMMDQASFVRQAVSIYYKYESGEMFKTVLNEALEKMFNNLMKTFKNMDINDVNAIINKEEAATDEELNNKEQELLSMALKGMADGFGLVKD